MINFIQVKTPTFGGDSSAQINAAQDKLDITGCSRKWHIRLYTFSGSQQIDPLTGRRLYPGNNGGKSQEQWHSYPFLTALLLAILLLHNIAAAAYARVSTVSEKETNPETVILKTK